MDTRITRAYQPPQAFLASARERRGCDLEAWITAATDSGIGALARFARGLREDLAALTAGLTLPSSNGPVEGQITRLKLLKRQSHGRAGSALLRQHVLQALRCRGRRATRLRPPQVPAHHGVRGRVVGAAYSSREGDTHSALASHNRKGPTLVHQN
jgi:hypothetical protein